MCNKPEKNTSPPEWHENLEEMDPLTNLDASFISGPNSGSGVNIQFYTDHKQVVGKTTLDERHQGPPGHTHGGCLLAILDEAMGTCAWVAGYMVLAAHVELDFKKPVPLGVEIFAEAQVMGKEGRKVFTEGKITLANGDVACVSTGIFVEKKDFFTHNRFSQ